MATYLNCYEIAKQVRMRMNEYDYLDENYLQGTDETGAYKNAMITNVINSAQRFIYNFVYKKEKGIFLKSTSLTGVSSVYTLPADYGTVAEFRDANGYKIFPIQPAQFKRGSSTGDRRLYYRSGNTFVLDSDNITDTYTLWYYSKCREIDFGTVVSGGAQTAQLATTSKKIADYYNGMTIEDISSDWVDTISDYSESRVATTASETSVTGDYYGLVSELPEPFHQLILDRTLLELKSTHVLSQEEPSGAEVKFFTENLVETVNAYIGAHEDIPIEDIYTDFENPTTYGRLHIKY